EVHVPAAALATLRHDDALACLRDVEEELVRLRVVDLGPDGNVDDQVAARAAVHVLALAVLAAFGPKSVGEREVVEGGQALVANEDDVTTASAVTTGRATAGNEFLAAEGNRSVASIT